MVVRPCCCVRVYVRVLGCACACAHSGRVTVVLGRNAAPSQRCCEGSSFRVGVGEHNRLDNNGRVARRHLERQGHLARQGKSRHHTQGNLQRVDVGAVGRILGIVCQGRGQVTTAASNERLLSINERLLSIILSHVTCTPAKRSKRAAERRPCRQGP